MLLRLFAFCVMLLSAGCVAPRAGALDETGLPATSRQAQVPAAMARQQAARAGIPTVGEPTPAGLSALPEVTLPARPRPAIVKSARPLECVPYARELSNIALRGNAWTWWQKAEGRYERGSVPKPGAVMVLSKTRRLRLGHLAVVAEILNSREIVVHQANWLNRGQIHRNTPVRDVSKNNDWSVVRVWYTPGQTYGSRHYPAYGFIYPNDDETPEFRQAAK